MATHVNLNSNFKLGPLRGLRGSLSNSLISRNLNQQIGELLERIFKELIDTHYPLVKRDLFSLVNIHNTISGMSVGYTKTVPKEMIPPTTDLVLTFAMTAKPVRAFGKIHTTRASNDSWFVGHEGSAKTYMDYLVVTLKKNEVNDLLEYRTQADLAYIYNMIGAITKNFVDSNSWWKENQKFPLAVYGNVNLSASLYADMHIKDVIGGLPYNLWCYNRSIWRDANNLLSKYHFSERFCLYFVMFIHEFVTEDIHHDAEDFIYSPVSILTKTVEKGVRTLATHVKSGTKEVNTNVLCAFSLMYSFIEQEPPSTEETLKAAFVELIDRLSLEHYAESKQMLVSVLGASQAVASTLIQQSVDPQLTGTLELTL